MSQVAKILSFFNFFSIHIVLTLVLLEFFFLSQTEIINVKEKKLNQGRYTIIITISKTVCVCSLLNKFYNFQMLELEINAIHCSCWLFHEINSPKAPKEMTMINVQNFILILLQLAISYTYHSRRPQMENLQKNQRDALLYIPQMDVKGCGVKENYIIPFLSFSLSFFDYFVTTWMKRWKVR